MKSAEIRQAFLEFFKSKGHTVKASASLVPDDPGLLFTVAGMVPFKPYFLGQVKAELSRAASCQKCIRTNDIENVGRTRRHHTFFEMLGNFSFGDYFKEGAIEYAWEFLTSPKWMGLPKEKLWASIYEEDDEAGRIWEKYLPKERIFKMGAKDNFWAAGPSGPCGPCSEIYYDFGPAADPSIAEGDVVTGGDRYVEIWNNVFMQFNRDESGKLTPLPKQNIDTGMGLERLAAVKQGVLSNFDTDLFAGMIQTASAKAGHSYGSNPKKDFSLRVVAEHLRASAFLVCDGVTPSNEGRGYVLRRILRRAAMHGRFLGLSEGVIQAVEQPLLDSMGQAYPDLVKGWPGIKQTLRNEEERFLKSLDEGMQLLEKLFAQAANKTVSGAGAFKLHDTFGFPYEVTREISEERGFKVDEAGFKQEMEAQRQRARAARAHGGHGDSPIYGTLATKFGKTKFKGYEVFKVEGAKVLALVKDGAEVAELKAGEEGEAFLDQTPFYAESGGQAGDNGEWRGSAGLHVIVEDSGKRAGGDLCGHFVRVNEGSLKPGAIVTAEVDVASRMATARHHSATHLLHAALRKLLGDSVHQGGSSVGPDRLRFDYKFDRALTDDEKEEVERQVNRWAMGNSASLIRELPIAQAKAEGAMALFGEKYGDTVRVVSFGDFSKELCGGTHLKAAGEVGSFRILSESSVSAGLRRIEAVAGEAAYDEAKRQQQALSDLAHKLKSSPAELPARIDKLVEKEKELLKQIEKLKTSGSGISIDSMLAGAVTVKGVKLVVAEIQDADDKTLKGYGDQLRDKIGSGVILLGSKGEGKATLVAVVTKDLNPKLSAGKLVAELAPILGGKGGGRPDMAQAGGKEDTKLGEALAAAAGALEKQM